MSKKIVISNEEMGLYVGNMLGMGFWTKWETAGQDCVVCFDTEQQAREHISSWETFNNPDDYQYLEVNPDIENRFASKEALENAGIDSDLLGFLGYEPVSTLRH